MANVLDQQLNSYFLQLNDAENPERYSPDKYRNNNDGSFRGYELHRYRIAYQFTEKEIIIVRVRHTGMEPQNY